jgi:uncharacterized protein
VPLSNYIKTVSLPGEPDGVLLFSTRKTSLVFLSAETFAGLVAGKAPDSLVAPLTRLGFWVADRAAERKEVWEMPAAVNRLNSGVRAAIILGMACNFACRYCYEGSLKGRRAMNDATAEQAIAFLQKKFRSDKKRMVVDFYGGEPLLYTERIKYLAEALKSFVHGRGGDFRFTLVTNGSLLARKTVEELLPFGLTSVKVTLDGPPENHNFFRPFKNGRGSFARILENIRSCCDLVSVTLGGNFTRENARQFPSLLDILQTTGLTPDKLAVVKFDAVMAVNDAFAPPEFHDGCASSAEPWLVEASLALREEVLRRGYNYPKLEPASCMVTLEDALTIDWDGSLYKCVTLIGHRDCRTGDVWQKEADPPVAYHLDHWRKNNQCPDCLYLPLCFGGCRYAEYQRCGSMAAIDCQKEYFNRALPEMLRQEIRYRSPLPGN